LSPERRVVIATASYGGGHEEIAHGLTAQLQVRRSDGVRVTTVDLLERAAPRSARLARVAYAAGEGFFPSGAGDLQAVARSCRDEPVVRELLSGGIAAAEAALGALAPEWVLAVHPVAAGIAAEVAGRVGCSVACVLPEWLPADVWVHPGCDVWFVATADARGALAQLGVEWGATFVSGVPTTVIARTSATDARRALGVEERFTAAVLGVSPEVVRERAEALAALGIQVLATGSGRGGSARASSDLVRWLPAETPLATLAAASDVAVCGPCRAMQWVGPAAGVPVLVVAPVPALERADVDLLVTSGAAMEARDAQDAAARAAFIMRHRERLEELRTCAARTGRESAARSVCEHVLASRS
jgi:UDP-N-acetylglucosamine:LPS N-acetylglucosamine transferase